MKRCGLVALTVCLAGVADAQDAELSVSAGARAWNTQWTTFGYDVNQAGATVLTQVAAKNKLVVVPVLSARYGDIVGSVSGYRSSNYEFVDGSGGNTRREFDLNVGYFVLPGLAATLGYKKVVQTGEFRYEPKGWVLGVSATAPLGGAFAMTGSFGLGRMKTSASADPNVVQFDADYRLAEVGLAYNLAVDRFAKALTFTAGYRIQVLSSKEALGAQDGRDLTQGLTLGFVATF